MQTITQANPIEIIHSVTSFYEVAWAHLMWFIGIVGVIAGIAIPSLSYLIQRRLFKAEEREINSKIDNRLTELRTEMADFLTEKLKQEMEIFDKKLEAKEEALNKRAAKAQGNVFHVQGSLLLQGQHYLSALSSYLNAALFQIEGDDERNLRGVLQQITICLNGITNVDLPERCEDVERINKLISLLKEKNQNGRYSDAINKLNKEFDAAMKRNPPDKK
jgi:tetratricopeptide (TPR) repeat protein